MSEVFLSLLAGSLTTLNPCVLPVLPFVVLGALDRHRLGPLALASGMATAFALLGLAIYGAGAALEIPPEAVRGTGAALLILFGLLLLSAGLRARFAAAASAWSAPLERLLARAAPEGLGGQFALGALLGAVWSPCSGPTLGSALALAAQSDTVARAALIMLFFGIGACAPLVALAYGSRQALRSRRQAFASIARLATPVTGAVLVAAGAFVLSGVDRMLEAALTEAMPEWLLRVTTRF